MCGIAGVVAPEWSREVVSAVVGRMVSTMKHRGPDAHGLHAWQGAAMGMRRLSIIDLATGDQPIANECCDVWVVQNGEIYNYLELRRELEAEGHRFRTDSDTETLVHGWEQWGEALLDRLNGMFAFAVWDDRTGELFIARDRMGIKPLYWCQQDDAFLFGSELKAITASGIVDRDLDEVAWAQYLVFEHVPAPRSIWRGVHKLEAGSCLRVRGGRAQPPRRYWRLCFEPDRSGTYDDRREAVSDAVRRATAMELVSDVPVGVLLSGGVDSSVVAWAAATAGSPPETFTLALDDRSFDESVYARDVAAHLGAVHHETVLQPEQLPELMLDIVRVLDEPFADSSVVPTYLLSKFVSRHVKVALGGDGGDELWAGYPTHLAHRAARLYRRLPRWLRQRLVVPAVNRLPTSFDNISFDFRLKRFVQGADLPPELQNQIWMGGWSPAGVRSLVDPALAAALDDEVLFEPILRLLPAAHDLEPMDRILYLDAELYLQGVLTKTDRASMACSLEVRVPLLNREVVDLARRVPFEWKLRGRQGKAILRDAVRTVVPSHVTERSKKGFNVPVAKWLRDVHRPLVDGAVSRSPAFVRRHQLATLVREHARGQKDHRKLLWPVLVLDLWSESWMNDGSRRSAVHVPFNDRM